MISAMPKIQSAQSHAAWDPMYHLVLTLILLTNLIVTIVLAVRKWSAGPFEHLWAIVMAFALILIWVRLRTYPLRNQDRIIRLEERVRLGALAPEADAARLTTRQLIALRFASDAELPGLVERTLRENLEPKSIKLAIADWRQDHSRI